MNAKGLRVFVRYATVVLAMLMLCACASGRFAESEAAKPKTWWEYAFDSGEAPVCSPCVSIGFMPADPNSQPKIFARVFRSKEDLAANKAKLRLSHCGGKDCDLAKDGFYEAADRFMGYPVLIDAHIFYQVQGRARISFERVANQITANLMKKFEEQAQYPEVRLLISPSVGVDGEMIYFYFTFRTADGKEHDGHYFAADRSGRLRGEFPDIDIACGEDGICLPTGQASVYLRNNEIARRAGEYLGFMPRAFE